MGIKEATAYMQQEHGGLGWWALKVVIAGAGLAILAIQFF